MNREKAQEILLVYGKPQFGINDKIISFSRQTEGDIEEIENKISEELIEEWKNLNFLNLIMGNVSLNDLERISLIELEMENRDDIVMCELYDWLEEQLNDEKY
jgi:hypothetical protein